MKKFALIGDSISHSLSPALFGAAYKSCDYEYNLIEAASFEDALKVFEKEGYTGANVTSPFKERVPLYCNAGDQIVAKIGASNVIIKKGGQLLCYNTDYFGVKTPLLTREPSSPVAIVVGAGGASKAAILALKDLEYNIFIINRTDEKAEALAEKFAIQWTPHKEINNILKSSGLIVYTIDHMLPGMADSDLRDQIIFEANYRSPLFNKRECKSYISGKEWLIHQAIPSFCLFTQSEPDRESMFKVADNC